MSLPTLGAMNVEALSEVEPLLTGEGRASSPCPTRRNPLRPGLLVANGFDGFDHVLLPESLLEVSDDDHDASETSGVVMSRHFECTYPVFPDVRMAGRSFNRATGQ